MLPVRVFFKKEKSAVYISHLDLQRAVFRAINRSGVRPAYTEGFNPHIKIVFAAPMSVGQRSIYEIFDFFAVDDSLTYDVITEKLRAAFPDGLDIIKAAAPVMKLKDLTEAEYEILLKTSLTPDEIKKKLSGEIVVWKKSKKGDHNEDLSGLIKSAEYSSYENGVKVIMRCACGSAAHLNVRYIVDFLGDSIERAEDICRTALLNSEGGILE